MVFVPELAGSHQGVQICEGETGRFLLLGNLPAFVQGTVAVIVTANLHLFETPVIAFPAQQMLRMQRVWHPPASDRGAEDVLSYACIFQEETVDSVPNVERQEREEGNASQRGRLDFDGAAVGCASCEGVGPRNGRENYRLLPFVSFGKLGLTFAGPATFRRSLGSW